MFIPIFKSENFKMNNFSRGALKSKEKMESENPQNDQQQFKKSVNQYTHLFSLSITNNSNTLFFYNIVVGQTYSVNAN